MENRFGIKDLILFLLLAVLIVAVVLAMKQYDRQYQEILAIKQQNSELTRDIVDVKRQLASGVAISGGGNPGSNPQSMEVFKNILAAEKMPGFARGDWLVDNFPTKIGRLTPFISTDLYQQWVQARVQESLASRDLNTLKFVPLLAESWEIKDLSKEWLAYVQPMRDKGMSWDKISEEIRKDPKAPLAQEIIFKIRRGVTFSDGSPMTAEDVVFTFDWVRNEKVNAPRDRAYLTTLKDVKANGEYEVRFTFTEPYFKSFETASSMPVLSKKFYSQFTPDQFNEKTGLLFGTGPYRLEDPVNWTPGKPVELVRNDRYWGVPGTFERLVYREIEDESAQMVLFGNQELDLLELIASESYDKMKKDPRMTQIGTGYEYPTPLRGYSYIGWNQRRKSGEKFSPTAFADKRVRQAMTMLIDRERIAREVSLGYSKPATGPFDPNGPQADPSIKPWPYDESRAKALLAEAGFSDRDGNGVIDSPNGQPFRFKLSYPSGSASYERIVLFIKDNLARAGIALENDPLDWPVLLDKLKRSDFDACMLGWGGVVESDIYQLFHSSQTEGQGDNRTWYINPELDRVIERARRTLDDDERMKVWHEAHRILHEDQPYTFMFNRPELMFINNRIKNIEKTKLGLNYVRLEPAPIPWFVPKAQQKYAR